MKHPHDPVAAAGSIGQQNAAATLKAILRTYPWQLTGTFSLVALENALLLAYPLFAGFAVDAIIRGNVGHAISYAGVVLLFWLVGAAHRAVDTRTFTRIHADLAVNVVHAQRRLGQATSARRNEQLHGRLNNRLEHEIRLLDRVSPSVLRHHYSTLSRLRILLSDREAGAFVVVGMASSLARLKDIGRRVSPGMEDAENNACPGP